MVIPPGSKKTIDDEIGRIIELREIKLDPKIVAFLKDAHISLGSKRAQNSRGPMKRSLIHYAAMGDCTDLLSYLLLNGAAIDDRDQNKRTPLSWAAEYSALNTVKILITYGAKINSTDDMYMTPLSWLIHAGGINGQNALTKAYLISKGAREKGAKRRWVLKKLGIF
jgi:ankyrin repeat protein